LSQGAGSITDRRRCPTASTNASKPNYIVDEKRTGQLGEIYSPACAFGAPAKWYRLSGNPVTAYATETSRRRCYSDDKSICQKPSSGGSGNHANSEPGKRRPVVVVSLALSWPETDNAHCCHRALRAGRHCRIDLRASASSILVPISQLAR
jgi:hypothetical protein